MTARDQFRDIIVELLIEFRVVANNESFHVHSLDEELGDVLVRVPDIRWSVLATTGLKLDSLLAIVCSSQSAKNDSSVLVHVHE